MLELRGGRVGRGKKDRWDKNKEMEERRYMLMPNDRQLTGVGKRSAGMLHYTLKGLI
jgi:hypothetical protein